MNLSIRARMNRSIAGAMLVPAIAACAFGDIDCPPAVVAGWAFAAAGDTAANAVTVAIIQASMAPVAVNSVLNVKPKVFVNRFASRMTG